MNVIKCAKDLHFYDADKFTTCPYCNASNDGDVTVSFYDAPKNMEDNLKPTEPFYTQKEQDFTQPAREVEMHATHTSLKDEISRVQPADEEDDDMGKTVQYYGDKFGAEPVVGWLIGLNGSNFGQAFMLKSGRNFIGRGRDMDVCLEGDDTVSRNKHAIVIYEPKSRSFIAQAGESRELFYVNDKVVLNNELLQKNDILNLGNTKLMFIPCCDEKFCWEDYADEK